jgi:hypothetical protein
MPLAFDSLSHGKIAFGFFNIETDLLLLNRYFFFASDFCRYLVEAVVRLKGGDWEAVWPIVRIEDDRVGDLMGAIHGVDLRGFIGEIYRLFPFPADPAGFKQNPEGFRIRPILEPILTRYGRAEEIPVRFRREQREVFIGEVRFNPENFQELLLYVWRGGYPRWRGGRRPEYVEVLKRSVEKAGWFPFEGIEEIGRRAALWTG